MKQQFNLFLLISIFAQFKKCHLSLLSKLLNKHHADNSHSFVQDVLHNLDHNPFETIVDKLFPENGHLLTKQSPQLDDCYSPPTFNGTRLSIFEHPIGTIIYEFLNNSNLLHGGGHSDDAVSARVKNVFNTIKTIAHSVHKCVHNNDTKSTVKPSKIGLTKFSSMSSKEISSIFQQPLGNPVSLGSSAMQTLKFEIAKSFFENQGSVFKNYLEDGSTLTEIKDQGNCGFCFLFAATAAIESSFNSHKFDQATSFSEKNLIDCMVSRGTYQVKYDDNNVETCFNGGKTMDVFREAALSGLTISSEGSPFVPDVEPGEDYPFLPRCGTDPVVARVTGVRMVQNVVPRDDYLKAVIFYYGPVAVNFRTDLVTDTEHFHGFFHHTDHQLSTPCNPKAPLSHVVTVVGWDEENWIIKNSYGNHKAGEGTKAWQQPWGDEGWLYLKKDLGTDCGLFGRGSAWYYPEVENEGPDQSMQEEVSGMSNDRTFFSQSNERKISSRSASGNTNENNIQLEMDDISDDYNLEVEIRE